MALVLEPNQQDAKQRPLLEVKAALAFSRAEFRKLRELLRL
jgi:hypothetical protein